MLADGSNRRFYADQMWLRSTQLTEDDFTEFSNAFNLPFDARNLPMEKLDPWTNMQWSTTNRPAFRILRMWANSKSEQSSNAFLEPHCSKRGHIPKKQLELN
jgi:hypothetical protein